MELKPKLTQLRGVLTQGLVERDIAVRLALLAALAGEHLLVVGPPGTAKSLLARRLRQAFADATYFERLLTRFSVPEELFGPLSVRGLEEDRYTRQTRGYLPEASIAFLDEIFKANSAILNALLTLLQERAFDNDGVRRKTPLISVIGASNELPEGEELDALYDRFLLRLWVGYIDESGLDELLDLRDEEVQVEPSLQLHPRELEAIRRDAQGVALDAELRDLLKDLRRFLADQGVPFSDRRLRKVAGLLRVAAWTDGRSEADIWDAWLVQHCAWQDPAQRVSVAAWWAARAGTLRATSPARLTAMVAAWEEKAEQAQNEQEALVDEAGNPLFLDEQGGTTTEAVVYRARTDKGGNVQYLAPTFDSYGEVRPYRTRPDGSGYPLSELDGLDVWDDVGGAGVFFRAWRGKADYLADPANQVRDRHERAPAKGPRRFSSSYLAGVEGQLAELAATVRGYREGVAARLRSLDRVYDHLWVPANVVEQATQTLSASDEVAATLAARLDQVRTQFAGLSRV
jgi:MoxR-like ATPase